MPRFRLRSIRRAFKVNLNPADWRNAADRACFLDACNPQIYTGDPISFIELARLPLTTRPRALVSTAMALLPGLRDQLESHFGCPAIDVYSMNETGPLAAATDRGHVLLQPRLYVETLNDDQVPCPPGVRGQVIVSGGMNPFLPLLRYRTGDWASLEFRDNGPVLVGLEGRRPVVFRGTRGQRINNIDVSTVLKPFALAQYALHQNADGSLRLCVRGAVAEPPRLRETLLALFGQDQELVIKEMEPGKAIQYTSDLLSDRE
jgi:phenylacetate-CoA ligase